MRCIAIGQAWQNRLNGSVVFASTELPASLQDRLLNEGFTVSMLTCEQASSLDAQALVKLALLNKAQAVVVDGYQFDESYLGMVSGHGFVTMLIDDLAELQDYSVDFVVNPHPSAHAGIYPKSRTDSKLLLGSRFMLLREEFLNDRSDSGATIAKPSWPGDVSRILVTLGGSDPVKLTDRVVDALKSLATRNFHACIVVGAANEGLERLVASVNDDRRFSVVHDVHDMAAFFQEADFAISGAGVSTWEMCYFGLPALIVEVADNQQANANYLEQSGVAINLGHARQVGSDTIAGAAQNWLDQPEQLAQYRRRASGLVDGLGARRCVNNMALYKADWTPDARRRAANADRVLFREADTEDAAMLLEWRNDALTREASRRTGVVSAQTHGAWLLDTIDHADCRLLIAELNNQPIGTVRIDIDDPCELSWTIAPRARQRGNGRKMIEEIVQMLALPMTAMVRKTNLPSRKIAEACGFKLLKEDCEWLTFGRLPVASSRES